jgi:hypothetical protein
MTRKSLNRTLRRVYVLLGLILGVSLFAKFADPFGLPVGKFASVLLKDAYEFLRDMALLIATGGVAYITNVFQKRSSFIDSLRSEWRDIIEAKSALFTYTNLEQPSTEQYLDVFCKLSETIDNMRIVYRNVGETDTDIGLYPYAPLHDMRRVLQTLDPRKAETITPDQRKAEGVTPDQRKIARDAILQSFYAVRETFLEELDLEEPDNPLVIWGGRRLKKPGSTKSARRGQDTQRRQHDAIAPPDPAINALLAQLYEKEQGTPKAWRAVNGAAGSTAP